MAEFWWFENHEYVGREERCWHTTFQSLLVKAKNSPRNEPNVKGNLHGRHKYPVDLGVDVHLFFLSRLKNGTIGVVRQSQACGFS